MQNVKPNFLRAKCLAHFFAFVLPYAIVSYVDYIIIGKRWYFAGTDSVPSIVGAGWSWLNFHPLLFDHPASFLHLLTAVLIQIVGGVENLDAINNLGLGIYVIIIIASGLWSAAIAIRARIPVYILAAVAASTCLMPAGLHYLTIWSPYFFYSVLCAPIGLGLYAVAYGQNVAHWSIALCFIGLGFLVGVFFLSGAPIIAVIVAVMISRRKNDWKSTNDSLACVNPSTIFKLSVNFIFIMFITLWLLAATDSNIPFYDQFPVTKRTPFNFVLGVIGCMFLIRFVIQRQPYLRSVYYGAGGLMLIGWLASVSVAAPLWAKGVFVAFQMKGSAAIKSTFLNSLDLIDPINFMLQRSWHWMLAFALLVALFAIYQSWHRRYLTDQSAIFCSVIIIISIILSAVISWDITMIGRVEIDESYGQISTYFLPAIPAVTVAICFLFKLPRRANIVFTTIFIVIIGLSALDYFRTVNNATTEFKESIVKTEKLISEFLTNNPDGQIICFRIEFPKRCGALYAFNYRSHTALTNLFRKSTKDKKYFYYHPNFKDKCGIGNPCPDPLLNGDVPKLLIAGADLFELGELKLKTTTPSMWVKSYHGPILEIIASAR